jgi:hypothetical protein
MPDKAAPAKLSLQAIIFLVISIAGFIFYGLYDKQVFPAASINLKLTQKEAGEKSAKMASSLGYDVEHARRVTTFTNDDDAKTVLEFKLGIDKANELMKDKVPVWLWHTRFCKELSKDEFLVTWTTQGQFKSIYHKFANDKKMPTISQAEALSLARDFIAKTAGMDLTGYDLFDQGSEKQINRTDYHFIWRKPGYKECEYRIKVEVAGDQVSTCRYWLAPTDTWTREYKSIRQWNDLLGNGASFFLFMFIAATIGAFIFGVSRQNVRWRFVLIASSIVAALVLFESINNFSYSLEEYDTSLTYSDFLVKTALSYVMAAVSAFVATLLIAGGGEVVYRATRPAQMTMQNLFSRAGMAQRDYARKTVMGYLLVGVMMFWAIGYYKIGQKLGYFCPLGVDDYKVLGNFCPAISGALIGVSAAGLEEFTCRVVALGLLQKLTKNFWLANLLQALVWGFAHSSYPQEPCYARGVELTVVGLLFGYIVKTYGVLPCLIAHYLYDAFLTVEPVFASHKVELILPSLLILVPFLVAVWYSRRWSATNKIAVESLDLTNATEQKADEAHEHEQHAPESAPPYAALSTKMRRLLILTAVLCTAVNFIPGRDPIGKDKTVSIPAGKAVEQAAAYLTADGLDQQDYQRVAELVARPDNTQDNKLNWQYIYEKLGYEKTRAIYNQTTPCLEWVVRFFKPLEPQSCKIYIDGDGKEHSSNLADIDEATGTNLDESAALAKVQAYIAKHRPEYVPFTLETQSKTAQPKRLDYKFDFAVPKFNAGDTAAILHAETKGDKIAKLYLDWKIPDDWSWPRKQLRWYQQALQFMRLAFLLTVVVSSLIWGVHLVRTSRVPWRLALIIGGLWSVTSILGVLNAWPTALMEYDSAETFDSFVWKTILGKATFSLLDSVACVVISIVGLTALRKAFPEVRQQLHSWILFKPTNAAQRVVRNNLWLDGAISSYALCAALIAMQSIQSMILSYFSPAVPLDIPTRLAGIFSTTLPSLDILCFVLGFTFGIPLALAFLVSFWQRFLSSMKRTNSLMLLVAMLWGLESWYWQNCLVVSIFLWWRLFLAVYFVRKIFVGNSLAYVFVTAEIASILCLSDLLSHADKIAGPEIAMLSGIIAAPGAIAAIFWLGGRGEAQPEAIEAKAATPS